VPLINADTGLISREWFRFFNYVYEQLGAGTGYAQSSADVSYDEGGTGAVLRSVQNKLRESVSVKDFGAVGDGVTDDTAAIQAAVNAVVAAGGGTLYFPSGKYLIGTTVSIGTSGVWLEGAGSGEGGTWIVNGTLNAAAIQFGNGSTFIFHNGISRIFFGQKSGTTPVAGNCGVKFNKTSNLIVNDILIAPYPIALYDGIVFSGVGQSQVSNIKVQGCLNNGVVLGNDCFDVYFTQSRSDSNANNGWDIKYSNGLYFTNCTAYSNNVNAWNVGSSGGAPYITNNLFFVNCVGDTSGNDNWYIESINSFYLANCWASSQKSKTVNTNAAGFMFYGSANTNGNLVNCSALFNNGTGLRFYNSKFINVIGGQWGSLINGNGQGGYGAGILIENLAEDITINAGNCTGNIGPGLILLAGIIRCNILGGNATGNSGGAVYLPQNAQSIRNLIGFNPYSVTTPAIPASNVAVINSTGVDCNVYLSSGTVTQIQVNGIFVLASPPATIFLPAGSSIKLIYTVAPIWAWVGN
jgi:hypothetical protein